MQDVDCIGELRHVDDPECSCSIPNPNLLDALTDGRHWLPIVGLATALHLVKLIAGLAPCRGGESAQIIKDTGPELDRFNVSPPNTIQNFV